MVALWEKYKWILIGSILVFIIGIGTYLSQTIHFQTEITSVSQSNVETLSGTETTFQGFADIKGEVNAPGMYAIESNMRLKDLIDRAGGFTENAAQEHVNLSRIITDEMIIVIPNKQQIDAQDVLSSSVKEGEQSNKVNLNTATKEQLMTIKGIGEKKALLIIEYRKEHGKFKTIEDLGQIKGFSQTFIQTIEPFVRITP
ncbi:MULTISPECIES: helix-hairpin-helix domain-containing protein [unclassified Granulicatella]|uniref:helix-hairpin-helix domain-containing protein n=1 Tax=unclassified Granulicatella TaxID=2630493 RepID=UPI0010748D08|nr:MULTISPECIES: helix-hairpin-helix domain-containing protein [unclassified Granulicatella]MBF0780020.1 helix-hairpin-helix domain-containing protein [Granulicatella sp. 19428wC4_WM01]TFU95870.1 hypothetical protein E4T68_02825 [Granulicatella sp. WM01]